MLAGDGMDSLLECLVLGVRGSQFSSICYRASGLSICQVKSIPSFGATGLASLIQKVEAPEGDGRSLGSLPGWFGGATRLTSQSVVKSMWQVTLRISLFRWWPLLFIMECGELYMLWGVWLPSRLPLEGVDRICTHGP
jgi:hypothetical protein